MANITITPAPIGTTGSDAFVLTYSGAALPAVQQAREAARRSAFEKARDVDSFAVQLTKGQTLVAAFLGTV